MKIRFPGAFGANSTVVLHRFATSTWSFQNARGMKVGLQFIFGSTCCIKILEKTVS
jgi:hypothetical protein